MNKYIEALEKIKEKLIGIDEDYQKQFLVQFTEPMSAYDLLFQQHSALIELINKAKGIATQALAPQNEFEYGDNFSRVYEDNEIEQPQECDVNKKYLKEILEELNCDAKWAVQNIKSLRKQLHSQQKTFTVEEVREMFNNELKELEKASTVSNHAYLIAGQAFDNVISEFEKAVE